MKSIHKHIDSITDEVAKKYEKKDKKKHLTMKVSGKSVLKLKKIIEEK